MSAESRLSSTEDLKSRAVAGSWWTLAQVLISLPVAFIANVIIVRSLGPDPYGVLAALTVTLGLLTSLTNFGINVGAVKFGSASWAQGNSVAVDEILGRSLGFNLLVQMPLMFLGLWVVTRGEANWVFPTMAFSVAMTSILSAAALATAVESRLAHAARVAIVSNFISQLTLCVVASQTNSGTAVWVARALVGALLLPIFLFALEPGRRVPTFRVILPFKWPKGFWSFTWPSAISGFLGIVVFSRSEVLILKLLNENTAAGIYALAFGLAIQVTAPIGSINNSLQVAANGLVATRESEQKRGLLMSLRLTSMLSAIVVLSVIPLITALIPTIYGEDFRSASIPFVAIGIMSCFQSSLFPFSAFLLANGESKTQLFSLVSAAIATLTFALILIPVFGLWGAILANGAGQILASLIVLRRQSQIAQIGKLEFLSSLRGMLVALCLVPLISTLFVVVLNTSRWLLFVAWILVLILILFSIRNSYIGVQRDELKMILSGLHEYIRRPLFWLLKL